jgi:hypothetical protein
MLGCLSTGLLVHLRSEQTFQLCQLMKSLDTASEYVLLIHQVHLYLKIDIKFH